MKRRTIYIISALILIVAAAAWLEPTQTVVGKFAGDAFFQGRPTRYWAKALRADPARQAEALNALEEGQAQSVGVLVGILNGPASMADAETRCQAVELLAKIGPPAAQSAAAVAACLDDSDPHVQAVCAAALPKIEAPAETAVPALIALLSTDNVVVAERTLSQFRGAAAPAVGELEALLNDKKQPADVRWNAARALGKIGPPAMSALDSLIAALDDQEWTIREHSSEALGELGLAAAEQGVPALLPKLADEVPRVRRDAVRSLGQFGSAGRDALPQIRKLLDDPEEIVRQAAETAVKLISSQKPSAPHKPAED